MNEKTVLVGSRLPRTDGLAKACGSAKFLDDLTIDGCWVGGTVRAQVPRGRIKGIRQDPSFDWSRAVLVTARDIPGVNTVSMIRDDYPALADSLISFPTQAVALVAAPDQETLMEALAAVTVDMEELPPVLTVEDSIACTQVIWGDNNVMDEYTVASGNAAGAFASADLIVEGTYRTKHQEHVYLETQGMAALPGEDGSMEVIGSMQCPYYVHSALVKGLGFLPEKVRVRQTVTGGGFGGKEDYPSILGLHAALLALKSGRPVKMVYDRKEDLLCTTKRHPSIIRHRTGVKKDGTLVAAEIDIILDGGAFTTMSKVVLSRSILHATGCYFIPDVSVRARAVATNTPPNGAYRGFGVPQSNFAVERHMDRIAEVLGMDPLDLRKKNLLKNGFSFPYGQVLGEGMSAELVLDKVVEMSGYREKRRLFDEENRKNPFFKKGIGLSLGLHGGGFTGSGEENINGSASVRVAGGEKVEVLVSSVEMGQGASTVLPMIAAETLGLDFTKVVHHIPDTSVVPNSGPTVASRTTMYVGKTVQDACLSLVEQMAEKAAELEEFAGTPVSFEKGAFSAGENERIPFFDMAKRLASFPGVLSATARYRPDPGFSWDEASYTGDAYKAYAWIANVVEVEVDMETFEISPRKAHVSAEIGKAVSPVLAAGQIEGGSLQAFGYAYLEDVEMKNGSYTAAHLNQYLIPTTLDTPDFSVDLQEVPFSGGPYGAKGLGELPMDSGAPALVAAVGQATGIFPERIPVTGEYLHSLLRGKKQERKAGEQ
ncbi:xanthine dehydrogenase family protein molybdopterin-binding subunit [Aminivibrio sp.]|uniref:xanthine dehydrogenase family protein molybdopterin-binding subunit n=1 Tax=Aminivibrio sp. TaxID=1872489 RepID=UPI001A5BB69C|nr:xanthine dehydrogenase family protein molybdopterin-binding subunit [Aminivibrio sp.]MBL3539208.1 xanthine dehydrogenase family protein [Aminivibrio sp.]